MHSFVRATVHPGVGRPSMQQATRRALSSSDQAAETNAQLASLHEVSAAADLAALGRRSEAAPLLERAVEICSGSMGQDSALTRAAVHRYSSVEYSARVVPYFSGRQSTQRQFNRVQRRPPALQMPLFITDPPHDFTILLWVFHSST